MRPTGPAPLSSYWNTAMKFLAILRDSLRETIDTKVFYVMVALSGLLTLFALGIGFTPGSPENAMKAIADVSLTKFPGELGGEQRVFMTSMMRSIGGIFEVTQVEALDNAAYPPDSRYRFVLRRRPGAPDFSGKVDPETPAQFQ